MRHSIRRMPELPDVVVYIEALERRIRGARLERVRVLSPFVLRSVDPPLAAAPRREGGGAHPAHRPTPKPRIPLSGREQQPTRHPVPSKYVFPPPLLSILT